MLVSLHGVVPLLVARPVWLAAWVAALSLLGVPGPGKEVARAHMPIWSKRFAIAVITTDW